MKLVHTVEELQKIISLERNSGRKITFIPTMGALHEGHLSLIDLAPQDSFVVLSIFVNPTQFGKNEDFDRYPRTLEDDLAKLQLQNQVDVVFVPELEEVYPAGVPETLTPRAGAVGSVFEGVARPGHFDGMLHIVHWFFKKVQPDTAIFGAKDAQQLFLIRRLVKREFDSGIEILEGPTVREADGLALSSRNRYLSSEARLQAPSIHQELLTVEQKIANGVGLNDALAEGRLALSAIPLAKLDYLALVDKSTFQPVNSGFTGEAQLIVAVVLDGVRLIDNLNLTIQGAA